ncbi:MAG: tol-pal system YbgF family protein [bacterium]
MNGIKLLWLAALAFGFTNGQAGDLKDKIAIGFNLNSQKLYGDTYDGTFEYGGNPLNVRLNFKPHAFVETDFGYAKSAALLEGAALKTELVNLGFKFGYRFLHQKRITPIAYLGLGLLSFRDFDGQVFNDGYGAIGSGVELFLHRKLGLNLTADYRFTSGDDFDGSRAGHGRDNFLTLSAGLNLYLGNRHADELEEYLDLWRPEAFAPVQSIQYEAMATENSHAPEPVNVEALTQLSQKRDDLLQSIAERDKDIKLLKLKLTLLKEQTEELRETVEINRVMSGVQPWGKQGSEAADSYLVHYQNALVFYRTENYQQAIKTFKFLLDESPYHALSSNCLYWLGECYFNLEDFGAAAVSFEKAAALSPPDNKFKTQMMQLMLGLSYWKAGRTIDARLEFQKLLQTAPDSELDALTREYLGQLNLY